MDANLQDVGLFTHGSYGRQVGWNPMLIGQGSHDWVPGKEMQSQDGKYGYVTIQDCLDDMDPIGRSMMEAATRVSTSHVQLPMNSEKYDRTPPSKKRVKITDETIEAVCAKDHHCEKEAMEEALAVEDAKKKWSAGVLHWKSKRKPEDTRRVIAKKGKGEVTIRVTSRKPALSIWSPTRFSAKATKAKTKQGKTCFAQKVIDAGLPWRLLRTSLVLYGMIDEKTMPGMSSIAIKEWPTMPILYMDKSETPGYLWERTVNDWFDKFPAKKT
eukprot:scaffold42778_cov38-Prasinocladus_malaysianus.AAC.1